MLAIHEVVHQTSPHKLYRGDATVREQYVMTKKYGKTTVHFVNPPILSDEEYQKLIIEHHAAGWAIWNSLTDEEKLSINDRTRIERSDHD